MTLTVDKNERVRELRDRYGITMEQLQAYRNDPAMAVSSLPMRIRRRTAAKPAAAFRADDPNLPVTRPTATRQGVALAALGALNKAKAPPRPPPENGLPRQGPAATVGSTATSATDGSAWTACYFGKRTLD